MIAKLTKKLAQHQTLLLTLAAVAFIRMVLLAGLPYESTVGYGDIQTYFQLAQIPGLLYLNSWSEYPPLFPFITELVFVLSNANQYAFGYILIILFLAADLANIALFSSLAGSTPAGQRQTALFAVFICALPYTWWYFDSLVVLFVLLSIYLVRKGRPLSAAVSIGLGALFKLFPLILLGWLVRKLPRGRFLRALAVTGLMVALVYGLLWALSPEFTLASLQSQPSKGSWQTVWAILDGNFNTGSFGPIADRLQPGKAELPINNPARISPLVTLPFFLALGFWRAFRTKITPKNEMAFIGLAWTLFFIWMPGWSPQWVYYLLPMLILALPLRTAALFGATLIFANLLEWPLLLSRGLFWTLPITILLRTLLLSILAIEFDSRLNK